MQTRTSDLNSVVKKTSIVKKAIEETKMMDYEETQKSGQVDRSLERAGNIQGLF